MKNEHMGQKSIAEELRISETRYRTLFDNSPASITLLDMNGTIIDCNRATEMLIGYFKDEIMGKSFEELLTLNNEDLPNIKERFGMLAQGGADTPYELEIIRKDGDRRWIRVLNSLLYNDSGIVGVQVISEDISEERMVQEALKESEEKFRGIFEQSPIAIEIYDPNGSLIDANPECLNLFGVDDIKDVKGFKLFEDPNIPFDAKEKLERGEPVKFESKFDFDLVKKHNLYKTSKSGICCIDVIITPLGEEGTTYEGYLVQVRDITEKRKAEDGLKKSEEKYRYLVENSNEVIYSIDKNGIVTYISPQIQSLLGYKAEEIIGRDFKKFVFSEDVDHSKERFQETLSKITRPSEYRVHTKSNEIRWIHTSSKPILNEGQVLGIQGILSDITERKKAEEALRESEEKYRSFVDNFHGIAYSAKENWIPEFFHGDVEEITGYSAEDFLKGDPSWDNIIHPDDIHSVFSEEEEKLHTVLHHTIEREYRIIRKDKQVRWIKDFIKSISIEPFKVEGALYDITARKNAEQALVESEEKFRNLSEQSPNMIFINNMGGVVYANKMCEVVMGYTREQIQAPSFDIFTLIAPEYIEPLKKNFKLHKEGKEVRPIEYGLITKDGRRLDTILATKLIKYEGENAILGIVTDITEHKKAEEALKESEKKHRMLFETMTQGVVYQNAEGNIISANIAAEKILGLSFDQMMGRTSMDPRWKSIHEDGSDFPGDIHPSMVALKTGEEIRNVVMGVFHPDKEKHVWININAVPQFMPGADKPYQVYTTFEDITHRIETEEHIKASLLEKELLLKEIHHRVKNNLQVISSMLSLQSMQILEDDLKAMFRESQGRVQTMAIVHEKMYQSPDLSKIGFAEYLKDLTSELFASYGVDPSQITSDVNVADIQLGVDVAIPCGLIVNELISNSLKHAFPNGEKGQIRIDLKREDDDKFNLLVSDNGVGFPKEIDFKQIESLGLRLVNTLVDQLKGTIELENNQGTTFKIEFKSPKELRGLRD